MVTPVEAVGPLIEAVGPLVGPPVGVAGSPGRSGPGMSGPDTSSRMPRYEHCMRTACSPACHDLNSLQSIITHFIHVGIFTGTMNTKPYINNQEHI